MAKTLTPASVPLRGNSITYYKPKSKTSQTSAIPTLNVNGKSTYSAPATFLKKNFKKIGKVPFGSKGPLSTRIVFRKVDLVRSALECGYGRQEVWTASLVANAKEASAMARYLHSRLEMVLSCVEVDGSDAWVTSSIYERIEASEKAALSYIFGGMGAYLVAREWLQTGGDALRLSLHVGIYAKGATPLIYFPIGRGKSPDFLVHSRDNKWHIFESKGGSVEKRNLRIVEGLAQLANVPPICWSGMFPQTAKTAVCVHASVDSNRAFELVAFDPPDESDDDDDDDDEDGDDIDDVAVGEGGQNGEDGRALELIPSVCKLLLLLETVDQYRVMADGEPAEEVPDPQKLWSFRNSSAFGGLVIGLPTRYLENESEVRMRMAVYLAALETAYELLGGGIDLFRAILIEKLEALKMQVMLPYVERFFEARNADNWDSVLVGPSDFFPMLARQLGLDELSEDLMIQSDEASFLRLAAEEGAAITSGGMYIRDSPISALSSD